MAVSEPVLSHRVMRRYLPPSRRLRSSASRTSRTRSTSAPSVSSRTSTAGEARPGRGRNRVHLAAVAVLRAGIDLGGTKIQAIVADEHHNVLAATRQPTPTGGGADGVVAALAAAVRDAAEHAGIDTRELTGVGLGSPGDVDDTAGVIANASNLVGFDRPVPVADRLREGLGVEQVRIGNDVSVATQAEFELGAGRDFSSLLGVFWGTGVGGGVILDGKEWHGRGAAGEIGHMVVKVDGAKCPCGRRGCMEAYAGRRAMEAEARERQEKGEKTVLFDLMRERGRDRLTAGIWHRAARNGDKLALHLIDRAERAIAAAAASAVNLLDVEAVILGGGMGTRFGEEARERLEHKMKPHLFNDDRPPALLLAALGDLGGALGAALLIDGMTPA